MHAEACSLSLPLDLVSRLSFIFYRGEQYHTLKAISVKLKSYDEPRKATEKSRLLLLSSFSQSKNKGRKTTLSKPIFFFIFAPFLSSFFLFSRRIRVACCAAWSLFLRAVSQLFRKNLSMGTGGALVGASSLELASTRANADAVEVDAASPSSRSSPSLPSGSLVSHDAAEADEYRPGKWKVVDSSSRGGSDRSIFARLFFASPSPPPPSTSASASPSTPSLLAVPDAATLADDWQHWSLTSPFPRLVAAILGTYAAVALLFAAALALLARGTDAPPSGGGASGSSASAPRRSRPFLDSAGAPLPGGASSPTSPEALLWFSVANLVSGGCGSLLPVSRPALVIATLEQLCGILLASLTLGALVARAQLPRARLLFSRVVLLTARDGEPHLVFRVCSTRGAFSAQPEVRARLVSRAPPTAEGEASLWSERELVLAGPPLAELRPVETLAHRVGSRSPLHGVRRADLRSRPRFIAVTVSAVDADTRAPLLARHVYSLPRDVVWGARFAEVLRVVEEEHDRGWRGLFWKWVGGGRGGGGEGRRRRSLVVDLARFHETMPLSSASDSASAPASASGPALSSPASTRKRSAAALPSDRVRSGLERQQASAPLLPPKSRPAPSPSSSSPSRREKEWPLAEFGGAAAGLQSGGKEKEQERARKAVVISSALPSLVLPPAKDADDDGGSDEKLLAPLDEGDAEACSRRAMGSLPSLVPPPPPPSPPPHSPQGGSGDGKESGASAEAAAAALHAKLSRMSRAVHEESAALGLAEATPSMLASEEAAGLLSRMASSGARDAARAAVAAAAVTPAGIAAAKSAARRRPTVALPPSVFGQAAAAAAAGEETAAAAAPPPPAPRQRPGAALLPVSPFSATGEQSRGASSSSAAAAAADSPHGHPAPPMSPFASCEIADGDEGGNLLVSGGGAGGGQSLLGTRRTTVVAAAAPRSAAASSAAASAAAAAAAAAADVVEAAARLSSPCSSGGP